MLRNTPVMQQYPESSTAMNTRLLVNLSPVESRTHSGVRKNTDRVAVGFVGASHENGMEQGESNLDNESATTSPTTAQPATKGGAQFWIVPSEGGDDPVVLPTGLAEDDVPDIALIAALAAGEVDALGALFGRHARTVFALLLRIVGDPDPADEMLQEVFLRAWQHAHTFDDTRGTVRNWLHGIAHNLALNELRRRRRRPQLERESASADPEADGAEWVATGIDPAVDAWCAIRDADLAAALGQLPPGQRAVLLLYAKGFSQSEISAQLGEPLGTVKSRMRRALCRLREILPTLGIDAGWRSD
jgi:RNA polymerase sigma-70 factor (ECF subfamily)